MRPQLADLDHVRAGKEKTFDRFVLNYSFSTRNSSEIRSTLNPNPRYTIHPELF